MANNNDGKVGKRADMKFIAMSVLCTAILAGCSSLEIPVGPETGEAVDTSLQTNSIAANADLKETIDPADLAEVRSAMQTALVSEDNQTSIKFENEITGTTGELTPGETVATEDGRQCNRFSTKMNSITGIQIYDGDACRRSGGPWELVKLTPRDSELGS